MTMASGRERLAVTSAVLVLAAAAACSGGPASPLSRVEALAPAADVAAVRAPYSVHHPTLLPEATLVPLERRGALLVARARIDGRDAGDFIVDTGANATVVDLRLADALKLPEIVAMQVAGIHADIATTLRKPGSLTVGDVELAAEPAVALPLDEISAQVGSPIAGIIGFPTFGSVPFTIDFARATLTIHNPGRFIPPAGVASELLRVHQNLPFVEATLENGSVVWLMLDTGAAASIALWDSFVEQHPETLTVPHKRWTLSMGAGGGTQVKVSELRYVKVFGREFGKLPVTIQPPPTSAWNHPRVAGLVGLQLLGDVRLTIHPDMKRMWVESAPR